MTKTRINPNISTNGYQPGERPFPLNALMESPTILTILKCTDGIPLMIDGIPNSTDDIPHSAEYPPQYL